MFVLPKNLIIVQFFDAIIRTVDIMIGIVDAFVDPYHCINAMNKFIRETNIFLSVCLKMYNKGIKNSTIYLLKFKTLILRRSENAKNYIFNFCCRCIKLLHQRIRNIDWTKLWIVPKSWLICSDRYFPSIYKEMHLVCNSRLLLTGSI